jgi:hypothetical protein
MLNAAAVRNNGTVRHSPATCVRVTGRHFQGSHIAGKLATATTTTTVVHTPTLTRTRKHTLQRVACRYRTEEVNTHYAQRVLNTHDPSNTPKPHTHDQSLVHSQLA